MGSGSDRACGRLGSLRASACLVWGVPQGAYPLLSFPTRERTEEDRKGRLGPSIGRSKGARGETQPYGVGLSICRGVALSTWRLITATDVRYSQVAGQGDSSIRVLSHLSSYLLVDGSRAAGASARASEEVAPGSRPGPGSGRHREQRGREVDGPTRGPTSPLRALGYIRRPRRIERRGAGWGPDGGSIRGEVEGGGRFHPATSIRL